MRILIDTPRLAAALPTESPDHWLIEELLEEQFDLCVSDAILSDYENILTTKYNSTIANNFLLALNYLPNVFYTRIHYHWHLLPATPHGPIPAADQHNHMPTSLHNHWIDTYTAAGADYLLTQSPAADALKALSFPAINAIAPGELKDVLQGWK